MSVTVFDLAKRYYPHLWSNERIETLVRNGRLTKEEYKMITGGEFENGNDSESDSGRQDQE